MELKARKYSLCSRERFFFMIQPWARKRKKKQKWKRFIEMPSSRWAHKHVRSVVFSSFIWTQWFELVCLTHPCPSQAQLKDFSLLDSGHPRPVQLELPQQRPSGKLWPCWDPNLPSRTTECLLPRFYEADTPALNINLPVPLDFQVVIFIAFQSMKFELAFSLMSD